LREARRVTVADIDILLIDHDEDRLERISFVLGEAGYTLLAAADADEGHWLFATFGARVVITDLVTRAPHISETIAAMRLTKPSLKVLAVSGGAGNPAVPSPAPAAANDVLVL
jgi:DNA-binding response OmpR family regulator